MADWIPLIALDALSEGRGRHVCTAGHDLAVFRLGDVVYAIDDSCPHAGASLSAGRQQRANVICSAHGLSFKLDHRGPQAPVGLQPRTYAVRVIDGTVMFDPAQSPAELKIE